MSTVRRAEHDAEHDDVPAPVGHPGALTFTTPQALAAMAGTGGTTVGVPVPVNGHPVHPYCPGCDDSAGA